MRSSGPENCSNTSSYRLMESASPFLPLSSDTGASKFGAPAAASTPSSPCSLLPESWSVWGSRFWALAEESSDEEEVEEPRGGEKEVSLSPRSGPSSVTFEDFLSPPWQQVDGSRASAAGRRRRGRPDLDFPWWLGLDLGNQRSSHRFMLVCLGLMM
jgi:hypothetical protein